MLWGGTDVGTLVSDSSKEELTCEDGTRNLPIPRRLEDDEEEMNTHQVGKRRKRDGHKDNIKIDWCVSI